MELQQLIELGDKLSIIVLLLYMLQREARRADRLELKLITTLEIKDRESKNESE